jgi:hypothetical protein
VRCTDKPAALWLGVQTDGRLFYAHPTRGDAFAQRRRPSLRRAALAVEVFGTKGEKEGQRRGEPALGKAGGSAKGRVEPTVAVDMYMYMCISCAD